LPRQFGQRHLPSHLHRQPACRLLRRGHRLRRPLDGAAPEGCDLTWFIARTDSHACVPSAGAARHDVACADQGSLAILGQARHPVPALFVGGARSEPHAARLRLAPHAAPRGLLVFGCAGRLPGLCHSALWLLVSLTQAVLCFIGPSLCFPASASSYPPLLSRRHLPRPRPVGGGRPACRLPTGRRRIVRFLQHHLHSHHHTIGAPIFL